MGKNVLGAHHAPRLPVGRDGPEGC
jgi:hypothetical protein